MRLRKQIIKILSNLTLWHVLFWMFFCFLFSLQFIESYLQTGTIDNRLLFPGLAYGINLLIIVYLNYFVFIPYFAAKKLLFKYFVFLFLSVVLVAISFVFTFKVFMGVSLKPITILSFVLLEIFYIMITSFFKFFKEWVQDRGLQIKVKEIEKQRVEAELLALKSQLNPHFLFNVLNSIYSHSLLKSDITPSIVLKLSDLMSYILYDCSTETVLLNKEIDFIKNYIELEKIRLEEDFKVSFKLVKTEGCYTAPLLFVPLIENAFKHGIGTQPETKSINLLIDGSNDQVHFKLENTKGKTSNLKKNSTKGGIGIENVKKRLELLYPDKHEFRITNSETAFIVDITIVTSSEKTNKHGN
jgi:two-component system, LytTR family, sensor kinase